MPNMIHSLDSSYIHLLCTNADIYTIHDCFAANISYIEAAVNHQFECMYFNQDYLKLLDGQ